MIYRLRRLPLHPGLFAVAPILALLAHNIIQVEAGAALRPAVVALLATALLQIGLTIASRQPGRAALLTTWFLVLFFSYGHVYIALRGTGELGAAIARHRFLAPFYAALALAGAWYLLRRLRAVDRAAQLAYLLGAALLVVPGLQLADHVDRLTRDVSGETDLPPEEVLHPDPAAPLPDVYLIIADTYMRSDALQSEFGYDNSWFVDGLESLGFYVPSCSRSNYSYTQASLAAVLNLDYLQVLTGRLLDRGLDAGSIWSLIKHSRVRDQLEALGYSSVAFDTGYDWSRLADADVYLSPARTSSLLGVISPFEALVLRTSAASILLDSEFKLTAAALHEANYPVARHRQRQEFILDELPQAASFPGPKFVFVHILVPHGPYVFAPDGSFRTDPGFYGGPLSEPINEEYQREGYTGQVAYLNTRLLAFFRDTIASSGVPPIFVLMGDHGLRDDNRLQNLLALRVPASSVSLLYPSMTPVNAFRAVFDGVFGAHYGLLPDQSFLGGDYVTNHAETAPGCIDQTDS